MKRGFILPIILIIVFIAAGVFLLAKRHTAKIDNNYKTISPQTDQSKQSIYPLENSFVSPDNNYSYSIKLIEDVEYDKKAICEYSITNLKTQEVIRPTNNRIDCNYSYYADLIHAPFKQWVSEDRFLHDLGDGNIYVMDAKGTNVDTVRYDNNKYSFISADKNLKYFLFRTPSINQAPSGQEEYYSQNYTVLLMDKNGNTLKEVAKATGENGATKSSTDFSSLYDFTNNLFVIIKESVDDKYVAVSEIYTLDPTKSLNLQLKAASKPKELPQRGCVPTKISSSNSTEINLEGDCSISPFLTDWQQTLKVKIS